MGKEFTTNVTISSNLSILGTGSVYGQMVVGAAAAEIKVDAAKLSGRGSVVLNAHPDNAGYIYLGLDNLVTATKYFYVLAGGAGVMIEFDVSDNVALYAYGSIAGQKMGVLESIA